MPINRLWPELVYPLQKALQFNIGISTDRVIARSNSWIQSQSTTNENVSYATQQEIPEECYPWATVCITMELSSTVTETRYGTAACSTTTVVSPTWRLCKLCWDSIFIKIRKKKVPSHGKLPAIDSWRHILLFSTEWKGKKENFLSFWKLPTRLQTLGAAFVPYINLSTVFTAFSVLHTNYEPKISERNQHLVCRTLLRNMAHY